MIANRTIPQRLDRLAALLAGLLPRIEIDTNIPDLPGSQSTERIPAALHMQLIDDDAAEQTNNGEASIVVKQGVSNTPRPQNSAECLLIVHLEGPAAGLLLEQFRQPLHIQVSTANGQLYQALQLIRSELARPRCGHDALLQRAGEILFIGLLRHLIEHPTGASNLFRGLSEPRIARAMVAIHSRPEYPWILSSLAKEAGMSRTAFASLFRELVGQTPGKYLTDLRLAIARRLVANGESLKFAARHSGYANASALSRALSNYVP